MQVDTKAEEQLLFNFPEVKVIHAPNGVSWYLIITNMTILAHYRLT